MYELNVIWNRGRSCAKSDFVLYFSLLYLSITEYYITLHSMAKIASDIVSPELW